MILCVKHLAGAVIAVWEDSTLCFVTEADKGDTVVTIEIDDILRVEYLAGVVIVGGAIKV